MSNFQWYPLNLNLIKNIEDTVVFPTRNVFISASFSIASLTQEMQVTYAEKPQMKINSLKKQKH